MLILVLQVVRKERQGCWQNCSAFPVEMHDRTLPEGRKQVITCEPGDVCIIACPVYAGGIPDVPGLFENIQGDGTPCVLLATYGNRHYDNALAKLKERMGTVGFLTIGAMAAVIPHVFSDQLGAGRPNDEDRSHMADFAMEILQKVNNWDVECPVIPGDASAPAKRMAYLPKTLDRERCTGCGTCARECPAGANRRKNTDDRRSEMYQLSALCEERLRRVELRLFCNHGTAGSALLSAEITGSLPVR